LSGTPASSARRPPPSSSAFARLLGALNDVRAPASGDAFAQRLSHWFGWTDAIALSAALDSPVAHVPPAFESAQPPAALAERELARVIAGATAPAEPPRPQRGPARHLPTTALPEPDTDFALHRHTYVTTQQAMELHLVPLRRSLRAALVAASPDGARLASLDTVMEQVLGGRERALLATVPQWLERRFEALRQAHAATLPPADPDPASDAATPPRRRPPAPWLAGFLQDMQGLLLAELELRLHPVEGLLAALRDPSSPSPVSP